jgi:cardiolipin synthase
VATPDPALGEDGSAPSSGSEPPSDAPAPGAGRIATVPNVITLVRLLCLPVYLWLLLGLDDRLAAAALLAVLGATDFVDGYIARRFDQASDLGAILDPVADRLLFFVGIGGILVVDGAPRWFSIVVLARELLVGATAVILALLGAKRIDVTWFGKAGTFGLMVAFPLFLAGSSDAEVAPTLEVLAWLAAIPGLMFSLYAAGLYVPIARRALREGRADRAVSAGGETG